MRKLLLITFVLSTMVAQAQIVDNNPKDLWTTPIEVTLGDDWRQKTISVPGKEEPNVIDFFRAFAKAYPCEYHDLLTLAIDGDEEVLFNHEKPKINIDKDSCFLQNGSFAMRVFYDKNDQLVALGVCCHKALLTKQQDAYYYRYNKATRKLIPLAKGSDFTGGMVKRETEFHSGRDYNEATMSHQWGRCGISSQLVWDEGKFILKDKTKGNFAIGKAGVMSVLRKFLEMNDMELRKPKPSTNQPGGSILSLPICVAVIDKNTDNYVSAAAMEGDYYFYAREWERADSTLLVAVYTACAPEFDYEWDHKTEDGHYVKTPHKLSAGDEVSLSFYYCNNKMASYLDPASPMFETLVGKDLPNLDHNEWRCVLSPDNEDLIFVNESDGQQKVFKWDGESLKEQ